MIYWSFFTVLVYYSDNASGKKHVTGLATVNFDHRSVQKCLCNISALFCDL